MPTRHGWRFHLDQCMALPVNVPILRRPENPVEYMRFATSRLLDVRDFSAREFCPVRVTIRQFLVTPRVDLPARRSAKPTASRVDAAGSRDVGSAQEGIMSRFTRFEGWFKTSMMAVSVALAACVLTPTNAEAAAAVRYGRTAVRGVAAYPVAPCVAAPHAVVARSRVAVRGVGIPGPNVVTARGAIRVH